MNRYFHMRFIVTLFTLGVFLLFGLSDAFFHLQSAEAGTVKYVPKAYKKVQKPKVSKSKIKKSGKSLKTNKKTLKKGKSSFKKTPKKITKPLKKKASFQAKPSTKSKQSQKAKGQLKNLAKSPNFAKKPSKKNNVSQNSKKKKEKIKQNSKVNKKGKLSFQKKPKKESDKVSLKSTKNNSKSGGLNLYKWDHNTSTKVKDWKKGDHFLYLPKKGSPKANWKQNAGRLREAMKKGKPIYDSYRNPKTGAQIRTGQKPKSSGRFLNAERKLLESRGWKYNPQTGAYHPPKKKGK